MINQDPQLSITARALANRLRLMQVESADQDAESRTAMIHGVIREEQSQLRPDQREQLLDELCAYFPAWEPEMASDQLSANELPLPRTDARELDDWTFLVRKLIAVAAKLSDEERATLATRLGESGLLPRGDADLPREQLAQLLKVLGVPPDKPIDVKRLLEFTAVLADTVFRLDAFAWEQWKQIAPQSTLARRGVMKSDSARFVTGDQRVQDGSVAQHVTSLRLLTAGLIQAVNHAGGLLHQEVLDRFDHERIEVQAKASKGTIEGLGTACWRLYKEMSPQLSRSVVTQKLRDAVRKSVEDMPRG